MNEPAAGNEIDAARRFHAAGRVSEADAICRRVLAKDSNDPAAQLLLGVMAAEAGRFQQAEEILRRLIRLKPGIAEAYYNLGNVLRSAGKREEAIEIFGHALRLKPNFVEAANNLGSVYREAGRLDAAIAAFRKVTQIAPRFGGGYSNLGIALTEIGRLDEAIAVLKQAIQLAPTEAEPHFSFGNALWEQRRYPESIESYERALRLDPRHASAHYNLSRSLLQTGDFNRGWPEYEWRLRAQPRYWFHPDSLAKPQWDGRELDGQTIFLHAEQGFGDTLQFVRYAPMVAARGGRVTLCCPAELVRLLKCVPAIERVAPISQPPANFDLHCPLMSLPMAFRTELPTIPARDAYLHPDPALVQEWKSRLAPSPNRMKVGLVWSGSVGFKLNRARSMSISDLAPLANVPNVDFFSLQIGPAAAQTSPASLRLIDRTGDLTDFADTAAMVANLDLVITVDTAVAHLSGAMGKPTWLLVSTNPDWRWLLDRTDSPWYPSMRLFRQSTPGNWGPVIQAVAEALSRHEISAGRN